MAVGRIAPMHDHRHEDGHVHAPAEAPYVDEGPQDGPPESLVLDIGGEIGALVLYATEECLGWEIDLTPRGQPQSHLMHTMIRRRRSFDRQFIVGVYPELAEGPYVVWGVDGRPLGDVDVVGGQVRISCRQLSHRRLVGSSLVSRFHQ